MGTKYQSISVRNEHERRARHIRAQLADPVAVAAMDNPLHRQREAERIEKHVQKITPPPYESAEERDADRREFEILSEVMRHGNPARGIVPNPSRRQMDDNPDGSTGQYRSWERQWAELDVDTRGDQVEFVKAKDGYGAKFRWKDMGRRLAAAEGREVDDPDCANLERLRPDAPVPLIYNHAPVSFSVSGSRHNREELAKAKARGEPMGVPQEKLYALPESAKPKKRGPGRPKGSKNKPKE